MTPIGRRIHSAKTNCRGQSIFVQSVQLESKPAVIFFFGSKNGRSTTNALRCCVPTRTRSSVPKAIWSTDTIASAIFFCKRGEKTAEVTLPIVSSLFVMVQKLVFGPVKGAPEHLRLADDREIVCRQDSVEFPLVFQAEPYRVRLWLSWASFSGFPRYCCASWKHSIF